MNSDIDISTVLQRAGAERLNEIIREAEVYLQAQLTASLASDQRAIAFTSLVAPVAAVVGGAAIALITEGHFGLGSVGLLTAVGFLVAMLYANMAAMPAPFEFPGNTPAQWVADIEAGQELELSLAQQAAHYAAMIDANDEIMRRNAAQMHTALWVAWASLAVGGITAVLMIV